VPPTETTTAQKPPAETTTVPPESEAASAEKQELMNRIDRLQEQLNDLLGTPGVTEAPGTVGPGAPDTSFGPRIVEGPTVSGTYMREDLLNVLTDIANQAGVMIYVDETVKPSQVSIQLNNVPITTALQEILRGPGYTFQKIGDDYLVFLPINNAFMGDDLREALQTVAMVAGVQIVPDETVTGQVYADLQGVPLETALDIMLAGTPFVVKKTPNYYLVANRKIDGSAFPEISETRYVRMNYMPAETAVRMLSTAFAPYVKAEGASDANSFGVGIAAGRRTSSGRIVTVTAPPSLAERIVADLKQLDTRPRHVLLDARVVAMDRGDLLNLGVEWDFPSASAGALRTGGGEEATDWLYGLQIGFSFDRTFTNALLATLNMLQQNQQADIISSPQVLAQHGKRSEIRVVTEEYFMLTAPFNDNFFYSQSELEKIESGTILTITPYVGDNNDITLEMSVEVSDSIPSGQVSGLPVVTRRTASNAVSVRDGGTVALAGLTENRSRTEDKKVPGLSGLPLIGGLFRNENDDRSTREIAVFVTAHLVPDAPRAFQGATRREQRMPAAPAAPTGGGFSQRDLEESLLRQRR
jgi:type II secretory pathway component GspD/PulD (secretin)